MLATLPDRARAALLGLLATIASFVLFRGSTSTQEPSADPLDAAPRGSFLLASANLRELRRSPLYGLIFSDGSKALTPYALGFDKLSDACGFEPLDRVDRLMVAVPEEGERGELGIAAHILATSNELSACAERLAAARGQHLEPKTRGSFAVLEAPSSADTSPPRIAYGRGNLLVVGRRAWFDALLAAAEGTEPRAMSASAHATLRAALTEDARGHAPALVVTALLPRALRDKLKREMARETEGGAGGAGPGDERSRGIMSGVLGVSALGLALYTGTNGSSADLTAELACDAEDACVAVEALLLEKRRAFSQELSLRMLGLGGLLDSITVRRIGTRIRVTAGAPAEPLTSAIDRILRLSTRTPIPTPTQTPTR